MTNLTLHPTNYGLHKSIIMFRNKGAAGDPVGLRGVNHLLEHLICKNIMPFMDELEANGLSMNAWTSDNDMAFHLTGLNEYCGDWMNRWADAVMSGKPVSKEEFQNELKIVEEEIRTYYSKPVGSVVTNIIAAHYDWFDAGGRLQEFTSVTYDQYVELLKGFKTASDAHEIGAVSRIDRAIIPTGNTPDPIQTYAYDPIGKAENCEPLTIDRAVCGILCPNIYQTRTVQSAAIGLMANILNGNWSSPFFKTIREERGLTYSPRFGCQSLGGDNRVMMFMSDTSRDRRDDLFFTYKELLEQAYDFITEERFEMNRKATIIGLKKAALAEMSCLEYPITSNDTYANALDRVNAVVFDDVKREGKLLLDNAIVFDSKNYGDI